ncbi:MAG: glycosyltransferase [Frankiaceae bacterium]|nr:glycosyltransferase [Frankiaceae bacterium]
MRQPQPSPALAGRPRDLLVVVRNEGSDVWEHVPEWPLVVTQTWWSPTGSLLFRDTGRVPLEADIEPGQSVEVLLSLQTPPEPGRYRVECTVRRRRGIWFESRGFRPLQLDLDVLGADDYARARVVLAVAPPPVLRGESAEIAVDVTNLGDWTWPHEGRHYVFLTHRWLDDRGRAVEKRGPRTRLRRPVGPGETLRTAVAVRAAATAGSHTLELTLVQQETLWFNESTGMTVARERVEVLDPNGLDADGLYDVRECQRKHTAFLEQAAYERWRDEYASLDEATLRTIRLGLNRRTDWPRIVVVVLVDARTGSEELAATTASLDESLYDNWARVILPTDLAQGDPFGDAIDGGDVCMRIRAGDRLSPVALFLVGAAFVDESVDWVVWDSDEEDRDGATQSPRFLAGYDPELAESTGWFVRSGAMRSARVRRHLAAARDAASDLELSSALARHIAGSQVRHLPVVLQTRRVDDPLGAVRERVETARHRLGPDLVRVEPRLSLDAVGVDYLPSDPPPRVSIVIPTRDRVGLLQRCVDGLVERTTYTDYELIIFDNQSSHPAALTYLSRLEASGLARIVRYDKPYSWSEMNNLGAEMATGGVLCLLNNDVEIDAGDWLSRLVGHALRPDVGVVGPFLWYGDNTLQHGGVVLSPDAWGAHTHAGKVRKGELPPPLRLTRTVSAVTGACLVTRRDVFEGVGGIEQTYMPVSLSDVDYCLRVQEELDLRVICTPDANLYHHESQSRSLPNTDDQRHELSRARRYFQNAWHERSARDAWASGSLSNHHPCDQLAEPPRSSVRSQVRRAVRRTGNPSSPRLILLNVPKSAGASVYSRFAREYSEEGVLTLSPRELLGCYDGDTGSLERTTRRLQASDVLVAHVSHGFANLLGLHAVYGLVVRDPVDRVIAQFRSLTRDGRSPLRQVGLRGIDIGEALESGVLASNLLCRRILGESPEPLSWSEIVATGHADSAVFAGYRLPRDTWWLGLRGKIDRTADIEIDMGRVARTLATDFALVTTAAALPSALEAFGATAGWATADSVPRLNEAPDAIVVAAHERALIQRYNAADIELYEQIRARPGSFLLAEALVRAFDSADAS